MAAKGNIAKDAVINKIKEAFGEDYLGVFDKKVYVQAKEGSEMIQVALTLTCPKNKIGATPAPASLGPELNFEEEPQVTVEVSEKEQENLAELLKRLGL